MENIFVWILIFAGATIGLLGIFLIASERELKKKRREVEALAATRGGDAVDNAVDQPSDTPRAETQASGGLMARNSELLGEISALSKKLDAGQKTIEELQISQRRLGGYQSENHQLRATNQQLQTEIANLKNQPQPSENHLTGSASKNEEVSDRAQLKTGLAALQEKLEEQEAQLREWEDSKERLANVEAREAALRDQQQKLEIRTEELKRELSAGQEKIRELDATRARLEETETLHRQVCGENRRLQEEIVDWQERLARSEENIRRLDSLRSHFGELQTKQASIADSHRLFQDELGAFAKLLDGSQNGLAASSGSAEASETSKGVIDSKLLQSRPGLGDMNSAPGTEAPEGAHQSAAELSSKQKRHFSIF